MGPDEGRPKVTAQRRSTCDRELGRSHGLRNPSRTQSAPDERHGGARFAVIVSSLGPSIDSE
jgi:hypothetical protein